MVGRLLQINILILIVSWVVQPVVCLAGNQSAPIAVLLSDSVESFSKPVDNFVAASKNPVQIYNLEGSLKKAPAVMGEIMASKPAMIFSLGAKASAVAKAWTKDDQDIPVLFAMVLNWKKYKLLDQENMAGIMGDVAPGANFANMSMVVPELKRVGVIYSAAHSSGVIAKARHAAGLLGIELVEEAIGQSKEFERAYKKIENKIDGFWILADPVIYTLDNLSWLNKKCIQSRKVCIGQSANVAKLGVLMAVDPDLPNIGVQAAGIARQIVSKKKKPHDIGVVSPLGTKLILNMKTAEKIGISIKDLARNMASEIIVD